MPPGMDIGSRMTNIDGVTYAAPSQVVIDCLTGNGRMPAEGEALLAWMLENEVEWRDPAITSRSGQEIR